MRESPVGWGRSARATGKPSVSEPPPRSALVITVSDGVAAGVREDGSGARLEERLTALGFVVERLVVSDDQWAIEAALVEGTGGSRPRRHDRWHGTHATGRDAAGHPGRHRLRRPRAGRGDARRRPREHATRRPVARDRRRPRRGASSSTCPAARRARSSRSTPSRACWTTPSRPSRDRTITRPHPGASRGREASDDVRHLRGSPRLPDRLRRSSGARPGSSCW